MRRALLSSELEAIFANAPVAPNSLSHARVQTAYAKAMGRTKAAAEEESQVEKDDGGKKRIPEEGDDCPICYDSMHNVDIKILTFCDECGNALHAECFQQCTFCHNFYENRLTKLIGARTANRLTCVWCRAEWAVAQNAASGSTDAVFGNEGYLNLGAATGVSPVRDTSSCTELSPSFEFASDHSFLLPQITTGPGVDRKADARIISSTNLLFLFLYLPRYIILY